MKTNIAPARICAYKILYDVLVSKAFSNISINKNLNASLKLPADRALCTNIVYGTIKKKNRLEKVIAALSKVPYDRIDPRERIILMMSLYQLFYLKKVPDYALINDAVSMSKFYVGASATGYTNAILRSAQRERADLTAPEKDVNELLHYEYGFDSAVLKMLGKDYDSRFLLEFAKASADTPPVTVRVNTLMITEDDLIEKLSEEGIGAEKTFVPGMLKMNSGINVFASECYRKGYFFAQDLSGGISAWVMGYEKGDSVLDLCAAPGAKSFNAAILTGNSQILSCDISKNKLQLLYGSAKQLGFTGIRTMRSDATEFNPEFEGKFDRVICDVPCSGLGVVRRKPEILYNMNVSQINGLYPLQQSILNNALRYVRPGGTLIYSTCTINARENERAVESMLRENPSFRPVPADPGFELPCVHEEARDGMLLLTPQKDGTDGFFVAKLRRTK